MISLVELLYFFTLRLYSIIIHRRSLIKSPDDKQMSLDVKAIGGNQKSYFTGIRAYNPNERFRRIAKSRAAVAKDILLEKTPYHDYRKAPVQQFLN